MLREIRYAIWGESQCGREMVLFHWIRDEASGLARAWSESTYHRMPMRRVWAVPYEVPS